MSVKNQMRKQTRVDRRTGYDRRVVHDLCYFNNGGIERRSNSDRRASNEMRTDWVRISPLRRTRVQWPVPVRQDEELPHTYLKRILK